MWHSEHCSLARISISLPPQAGQAGRERHSVAVSSGAGSGDMQQLQCGSNPRTQLRFRRESGGRPALKKGPAQANRPWIQHRPLVVALYPQPAHGVPFALAAGLSGVADSSSIILTAGLAEVATKATILPQVSSPISVPPRQMEYTF